ncbi:MAG: MFS transporter [Muribaculaceae bacterium]|nr:MFS transporter [Muribaculaceae bacterium]
MVSGNLAIKIRLSVMNFIEFAVWGAYLISMGMYLGSNGLGDMVFWFYTVQGLVSIFMPALIGIVADRWIPAQKTLSLCHLLAGGFMIATGIVASGFGSDLPFGLIFTLYTISVAFFMPTIGLSNSVAFNVLEQNKMSTITDFPPIRVFGTVGFIAAEIFVNFVAIDGVTIQHSYYQFYLSGLLSVILAIYSLTLPNCPVKKDQKASSISEALGLNAFKLFKSKQMAIFFIFSMLLGVSLQITNSYGTSFINAFQSVEQFAGDFWAKNPTFLISISQCAEALCILMIPFCLKRFGIKGVMLMAMTAWVFRFGFFGIGDTATPGFILLILSCIVYGVAFDFFNVSGGLYVDQQTDTSMRSSAQGLFMLMTNGIGASLGTFIAGKFVVNKLVYNPAIEADPAAQLSGWHISWLIFAAYALIVAILFAIVFKDTKKPAPEISTAEAVDNIGGGDDFVGENTSAL